MKYIIYGDDKAYEFTTDLYTGIEENMTEIPYSFTDDLDFTLQDGEHIVYLYEGGFSKMVFRVFTTEEANELFRLSYIRHLMV